MNLREYGANWRALPYQLWKAADRLVGVLVAPLMGDYPWSGETVSARLWRLSEAGNKRAARAAAILNAVCLRLFGQANHCRGAFASEKARKDLPPEYSAPAKE